MSESNKSYAWYSTIVIVLGFAAIFLIMSGMSALFTPKPSAPVAGGKEEAPAVGDREEAWKDMTINNKLVTNTADYATERNKVIAEIKKISPSSTTSVNTLMDFSKIVEYEQCRVATTSISLPQNTERLLKGIAVAIENNQCL